MRLPLRPPRRILPALLAFAATPALAQNLLLNPGFDRDLGGWTTSVKLSNPRPPPDLTQASADWTANDASGNVASGGLALHAQAAIGTSATAAATQCVAASPGFLATVGAKILTTRQYMTASSSAIVSFFLTSDCSGTSLGRASKDSLPFVVPETDSGGRWLLTTVEALVPSEARSVLAEISANAYGSMFYGDCEVIAVADDAFLTLKPATTTTWILPSAAWAHGAGGSFWMTTFTLCNPGSTDAVVALKWLGHDADGRGGNVRTYLVRAGQTLVPEYEEWELGHEEGWGAILVTSSSSAVVVQSETQTYVRGGGSVGQVVPALGPADFASATPKTLAPIREIAGFYRTNLVLANPTEMPLTAHVVLYAADGTQLGSRDIDLPPLGMTQINRVVSALGASALGAGRISVSTPTAGGLVATFASLIDNTTNDPRTILPH